MVRLFANNQPLDTVGVSFNITLKNPLFQNDLDSGYAYDIVFPETDRNKKHLVNYAHRLQGINSIPSPSIVAEFNGRKLFEGPWIYSGGKNQFRGSVGIGQGDFLYLAKNKYLDEIDYGSKTFADNAAALAYFNSIVDLYYPDVDFALPMVQGYQADCFLPSGTAGYFQKDNLNHWDPSGSSFTILDGSDKGIITPHLFLQLVLKKIFQEVGYEFTDQFFINDADFKNLIIGNIYNANGGIPDVDGRPGYDSSILQIDYNRHVPHTLISELISGLQNLVNVRFFFNHANKKVVAIDGNAILTDPAFTDFTEKTIKGYELEFESFDGFMLKMATDEKDLFEKGFVDQESYYEKMYGGIVDTIDDLPEKWIGYRYYYVLEESNIYYTDYLGTWHALGSNLFFSKFFQPANELSIESKIGSLRNSNSLTNVLGFGTPAIDYRDIITRLAFYQGLTEYASSGNYYPASSPFGSAQNLFYSNDTLYSGRWKRYLEWLMNTKVVKFEIMLSAKDISTLDLSKKYRINGIDYLFQEVKVPVSDKAIGPSTVTAYKV